jgi:hypothetical protein
VLNGRASSPSAFESHATRAKCIYSRVMVEQYRRGPNPWEKIFTLERREPFSISGRLVDPAGADIRVEAPSVFTGYLRPGKGLIQEFAANLRKVQGIMDITAEVSPNEFLDENVAAALLSLPGARDRISRHSGRALRVTEHVIPAGAAVSVYADPAGPKPADGTVRGSAEYPLIISDSIGSGADKVMGQKSLASIIIGSVLVLLSLALFLFLLFA